jgi:hypothetical protein
MKYLLVVFLLVSAPVCYAISVAPGSTVPFYINDGNLNANHKGTDEISTSGIVDFTINGFPISGPSSMTETSVNSGVFLLYLTIPSTVNGKPVKDGDVVVMTYHQYADYSGNPTTITQSVTITETPSSPVPSSQSNVGIGHYFSLKLYAPNWNLDSLEPDTIPLDLVEFRDGGFVTTLANPVFDIPTQGLQETGPNSDIFAAQIKIPRQIGSYTLELGSTIEFSFKDPTGGDLAETSHVTARLGSTSLQNVFPSTIPEPSVASIDSIKSETKIWCDTNSGDASFVKILQNLVENKLVTTKSNSGMQFPLWSKNTACWWSNDKITDNDFLSGIQFLIDKNLIQV